METSAIFTTFADFYRILTSGAFRHADYAWLHLGSRYLAPLALLHYMAAGEKRGLRPAPFFDPAFFARKNPQQRTSNLFAAFLRDPRGAPACAEYDEAWFLKQNPEAAFAASPWDYLRLKGIDALRDPSPDVSLAFVADAYRGRNKRLARTLMKVFERRRGDGKASCVLRLADLKANQAAFREKIVLETLANGPAKRPCLVFIQTSGGHDPALHDPARSYDLLLNYYQPPKQPPLSAEHVFAQNGTKTTGIAKLLEERPDLFASYDYVLFLDDDIGITSEQIAEFFAVMKAQQLDFAQPALTADSFGSFPALYHKADSPGFRRVNYDEIMMPALTRRKPGESAL
jgi:hypothetical protein